MEMRVKCQIEEIRGGTWGIASCGCYQTSVFLARRSGKVFLVYSNRLHYVKIEVRDNVQSITKHLLKEGKAIIQFKESFFWVSISNAKVSKLRRLLFAIKLASKGDSLLGQRILSDMKIHSKKNYPPPGFPLFLKSLKISTRGWQPLQFDSRILQLKYLVRLNLNGFSIKSIPASLLGLKSLSKLDLSGNDIEYFPDVPHLPASNLTSLQLGFNKIKVLPNSICNLNRLKCLDLEHNLLEFLPMHIGSLSNLEKLVVRDNRLWFLPASVWKVEWVSAYGNDFSSFSKNLHLSEKAELKFIPNCIPTLQEFAGRVIKKFKINYVGHIPNHLMHYLDFSLRCCCQTYCFADHIGYLDTDELSRHELFDMRISSRSSAYFQVGACSQKCLAIWKENANVRVEMKYE